MKNIFLVCMLTLVSMVIGSDAVFANSDPRWIGCNSVLDDTVDLGMEEVAPNVYAVVQVRPTAQYFYPLELMAYGAKCAIDVSTYKEQMTGSEHTKAFAYRCNAKPSSIRVKLNTPSSANRYGGWYQCKIFNT